MMELPDTIYERFVKRGAILYSEIFEEIDHGKYFVVIGIYNDEVAGFFFINSQIHPLIQKKPEQFAMQYPLRKKFYDFLKYDSFLCATAIQKIPVARLVASMSSGQTTCIGNLTDDDLTAVLDACRQSKLFRPVDKRNFFD